ncbi:MAG: baseplate assembly protein [Aeromonas sp.]
MIDLSALPPPTAIEPLSFEEIASLMREELAAALPDVAATLALPSEPLTKLIEQWAYRELVWRTRLNDALSAVLLPWSTAADLDNLAAFYDVERRTGENDAALRQRCLLSLRALSVAGPADAYRYHALNASPAIKDAAAKNGGAGIVEVAVLSREGDGTPTAALLATVYTALNAQDVRPLCDTVHVRAATQVPFALHYQLHVSNLPDDDYCIDQARSALRDYLAQQHRLGGVVTLSGLYDALQVPGIANVKVLMPANDVVADPLSAPHVSALTEQIIHA